MSYRRTGFDSRRVMPSLVTPSIHLTLLDDVDVTSTSTSAAAAAAAAAVTDRLSITHQLITSFSAVTTIYVH